MRRAIAWLLFAVGMTVWGLICAVLLANLVGMWTAEHYFSFVLYLVFLAWAIEQAREWWMVAPWKLKL